MFGKYLSENELNGFDKYKVRRENFYCTTRLPTTLFWIKHRKFPIVLQYKSIDTSPISNYITHPFWNTVVEVSLMWWSQFRHCQVLFVLHFLIKFFYRRFLYAHASFWKCPFIYFVWNFYHLKFHRRELWDFEFDVMIIFVNLCGILKLYSWSLIWAVRH